MVGLFVTCPSESTLHRTRTIRCRDVIMAAPPVEIVRSGVTLPILTGDSCSIRPLGLRGDGDDGRLGNAKSAPQLSPHGRAVHVSSVVGIHSTLSTTWTGTDVPAVAAAI